MLIITHWKPSSRIASTETYNFFPPKVWWSAPIFAHFPSTRTHIGWSWRFSSALLGKDAMTDTWLTLWMIKVLPLSSLTIGLHLLCSIPLCQPSPFCPSESLPLRGGVLFTQPLLGPSVKEKRGICQCSYDGMGSGASWSVPLYPKLVSYY